MSLKTDLEARGVKLTSLAKELNESYGNLYTALDREHKGEEVRHQAVLARQQKVRDWLATERTAEARVTEAASGSDGYTEALRRRVERWWHGKPDWRFWLDFAGVHCGDVLTVRTGEGTEYHRVLRLILTPRGELYVETYGGAGLEPKEQKHERRWRSHTLEGLGLSLTDEDRASGVGVRTETAA